MELKPCPFCGEDDDLSLPAGTHDYRLVGNTLYHFDSQYGWEGLEINFCPLCGKALNDMDNDPLTLDELRQMDGEPVFLKSLGEDFEDQYYIIASADKKRLHCLMLYCMLWYDQYGKTWIAYRRRPEEVKE